MIMMRYDYDYDMFLSSWYYFGSDSVYTGDFIDSLLNLHIIFPYYPLYLNMFPKLYHLYFSIFLFQFIIVISVQ
jgi:hypothetical protein